MSWDPIITSQGQRHGGGRSAGAVAGPLVFLSAIRGVDPETQRAVADPEQQFRLAFQNAAVALEAAGASMADVVRVAIYMTSLHEDRAILNRVWAEHFPEDSPARFAVEVAELGAEGDDSRALFEFIAVKPA